MNLSAGTLPLATSCPARTAYCIYKTHKMPVYCTLKELFGFWPSDDARPIFLRRKKYP